MDRKKEALSEAERALEAAEELTRGQASPVPPLQMVYLLSCIYIYMYNYIYIRTISYINILHILLQLLLLLLLLLL